MNVSKPKDERCFYEEIAIQIHALFPHDPAIMVIVLQSFAIATNFRPHHYKQSNRSIYN